ncbi:MAG: DUF1735 domain-containing protein [Bacteroidales bacterium]|nr:DUF1735 domain-containing protein [Candidatus Cryptobacteroides aphodequi]
MRYKALLISVAAVFAATSCHNGRIEFDDFETQSVYFPYQYPVRTLSLGNDLVDNTLDRAHEFNIGICIGGYYGNSKRDWRVSYELDETLVGTNLYNQAGKKLTVLPEDYYEMNPLGNVTIKAGTSSGLIRVHLNDAFFDDPKAVTGEYVIPLRITEAESPLHIITGEAKAGTAEPDRHNAEDWEVAPMDYTLFGVKFVNKFHGSWLRRGVRTERDALGTIIKEDVYHADYTEYDEVVSLKTLSLTSFSTTLNIKGDQWTLNVCDDGAGCLDIVSASDSKIKGITGVGEFAEGGESWGGTPEKKTRRDALYLNYFYKNSAGNTCEVCDTLVFRDRAIVQETARPEIKK